MSASTPTLDNASRIRSLRDDLAELRDPGAQDDLGHRLYLEVKASLEADLAELGAPVQVPTLAPRPVCPAIRLTSPRPPKPAVAERMATPPEAEAIHPDPTKPGPRTPPPADRLADLVAHHAQLLAADQPSAAGQVRLRIRKLCATHGLAVPEVASKRPQSTPYKDRKPRKAQGKSLFGRPSFNDLPLPSADPLAQPYPHLLGHLTTPAAAGRLRALRSQALELLPLLKDLSPDEAAAAHTEMDLLAKVLVLGAEFLVRRSA